MSSHSIPILKTIPSVVSLDDKERLDSASADPASSVLLHEEFIEKYGLHPYFQFWSAESLRCLQSDAMALEMYHEVRDTLRAQGMEDETLNSFLVAYEPTVLRNAQATLEEYKEVKYYQEWKPTKEHRFPVSLPQLPSEHQELLDEWKSLISGGSHTEEYVRNLAIDTNHIEGTFLLSRNSVQELVRDGIDDGLIECTNDSALKESETIRSILKDTVAAYDILLALTKTTGGLMTRDNICAIHRCLMKTCRVLPDSCVFVHAGSTRTRTKKTVVIKGSVQIECCPYHDVDAELDYICKMANQYIRNWRNPFATASWLHFILARCHPFEDGNGRLARILASLPLLRNGYPPISMTLSQRQVYFAAIRRAFNGDHSDFVQCLVDGMRQTLLTVKSMQSL